MLGSMPRTRTVRALVVIALLAAVSGCGSASVSSPPSGVDGLTIPTPSPDPADFVADVDNPWLPLPAGRTWTYDVVEVTDSHRLVVRTTAGPDIAGVATTARISTEEGTTTTDWFAQDAAGNVWWFGRAGEWRAGEDGAEAGLAMAATPRVGDGYEMGDGARANVEAVDDQVAVPAGTYDDVVRIEAVTHEGVSQRAYASGVGLVQETLGSRIERLEGVSG